MYKSVRITESAYNYIAEKAKKDKRSFIQTLEIIIEENQNETK